MLNNSMSQYRQNQISSISPEKTVLMLYDGAIGFLKSAMKELENNNIPEKAGFIEKTIRIIDYLQSCLDKEKGGIIADNLNMLYDYMFIKLTEANFLNDVRRLEEVIGLLTAIRDGWKDMAENNLSNKNGKSALSQQTTDPDQESVAEIKSEIKVGLRI